MDWLSPALWTALGVVFTALVQLITAKLKTSSNYDTTRDARLLAEQTQFRQVILAELDRGRARITELENRLDQMRTERLDDRAEIAVLRSQLAAANIAIPTLRKI